MADNTRLPVGTADGDTYASDDIGGVKTQRVKLQWGPDGTVNDVDDAAGKRLPVEVAEPLPAGINNIGDIDVLTVPAPLSTTGGGTETAALRVTIATNSTGVLSVDDNGAALTVDGPVAVDAAVSGNPVIVGARASLGWPGEVSADGDLVIPWVDRRGALYTRQAPGTQSMYFFMVPTSVHVAAASTLFVDMFNAHASLVVRVVLIEHIVNIETGVTGVSFEWQLLRTTDVGTGGSAITGWLSDTTDTAIDAAITCRSKPTGGATASTSLKWYYTFADEAPSGAVQTTGIWQNGNIVPAPLVNSGKGIVLRQNQGLRINQETNSVQGNSAFLIGFTIDGL